MASTEALNEEAIPCTEKLQGARGGGYDGLNKKVMLGLPSQVDVIQNFKSPNPPEDKSLKDI